MLILLFAITFAVVVEFYSLSHVRVEYYEKERNITIAVAVVLYAALLVGWLV